MLRAFITVILLGWVAGCSCSPSKTAGVVDPKRSTVTVDRAAGVLADGADHATITVTLFDGAGAHIFGRAIQLAVSGTGNVIGDPKLTDASGRTTGTLASTEVDTKTITVTVGSVTLVQQPTVQFVAGRAARLGFTTPPAKAIAGSPIKPSVQVAIEDANGHVVPDGIGLITLSLGGAPPGGVLAGTVAVNAGGGVATFPDLSISQVGTGYTLKATSVQLPAETSAPFDVTAGEKAGLLFQIQPTDTLAGVAIAPAVQVMVVDQFGNAVLSATDPVTLTLGTGATGATLGGAATVKAVSGVATFPDLRITTAGSMYTLVAGAGGLKSVTSKSFNVAAAAKAKLAFTVQPSNAQAGVAIASAVQVSVEDSFGNLVPTATDMITVSLASGPMRVMLLGMTTVTAREGISTFPALVLNRPGTYTLAATAGTLTGTSTPFDITSGPPSKAVFIVQPSNATSGKAIAPPVQVALEDLLGNVITTATTPVTIAIGAHPRPGTLAGKSTVNAVAGVATFSDLSIDTAGTGYTLAVAANGYSGVASLPFNISPGDPSPATSTVTASPDPVVADGLATTTLTITATDAHGNTLSGQAISLVISGTANTLDMSTGTTNTSGVFTTTLASTKAEPKTITATIGAATTSTTMQFVAGDPVKAQSSITANPISLPVDGKTTSTVSVTVADTFGNPTKNQTVTLSITGSGNTLTPASGSTGSDGVFSAALISTVAEDKSVTAVVGSFTLTTVVTFVPGAVTIKTSTVTATPASVTADGTTVSKLLVTTTDASGNTVSGVTVALTATGSNNTLAPTGGTTDGNGQFKATLASITAETKTVTADIGVGAVSADIAFTAGAPAFDQSKIVLNPQQVNADGASTSSLTVSLTDQHGNPVTKLPVLVAVSGTGNTITPENGVTDDKGVFTSAIASTVGEVKTVTVTAGTLTLTAKVNFLPKFALVSGGVGTLGTRPAPVNGLQIVDDGLEFAGHSCAGAYCVSGGIVP